MEMVTMRNNGVNNALVGKLGGSGVREDIVDIYNTTLSEDIVILGGYLRPTE
jgi:hypothetical protein